MSHLALYRKYRSQNFEELVGQEHVIRTLQNSITQGKIAHAYLFTGPRGTGKTSTARLLAKALNCTGGPSAVIPPDCPICAEIAVGSCMDVQELDAASEAGVDDIRDAVVQAAEYKPSYCRYRIFIIDEVHDLSGKAFDALLKTIEEPPDHAIFILATTEFNKVPPTIRSRCQKYEFHRATVKQLVDRLKFVVEAEGAEAEPAALTAIARLADGGFRDALTLLEQVMVTAEGTVTMAHVYDQLGLVGDEATDKLLDAVAASDVPAILRQMDDIYRTGRDPRAILESLLFRLSDLTRAVYQIDLGGTGDASVEASLTASANRLGINSILSLRTALSQAHAEIRSISLPRVWLESELVRIGQSLKGPQVVALPILEQVTPSMTASSPAAAPTPAARPTPRPAPADPTPAPVRTPRADGHPEDPRWQSVVGQISALSATAKLRLPLSRVVDRQADRVVVEFDRLVDADWVNDRPKLKSAIAANWREQFAETVVFDFVGPGTVAPKSVVIETATVESRLEDERLHEAAREIFGVDGQP